MNLLLRFCLRHCKPSDATTLFIITFLEDIYSEAELKALYNYWYWHVKGDYAERFCSDPEKEYYKLK